MNAFIIITSSGFFGIGESIGDAYKNTIKVGARKGDSAVIAVIPGHSKSDVMVTNGGNVEYKPEKGEPIYIKVRAVGSIIIDQPNQPGTKRPYQC